MTRDDAADAPLAHCGVIVTRPVTQAQELATLIEEAGGTALLFPTIAIEAVADLAHVETLVDGLDAFDYAIFISPNAVQAAMPLILARRAWPQHLRFTAIGAATARELQRAGASVLAPPGRSDSEALLALAELTDVAGKRVVIFRGQGGRELLGDRLRERGASVEYAECYRRVRPRADPGPLLSGWRAGRIHAATVTSSEGLSNLWEMIADEGRTRLRRTPLFVPHERIARAAHALAIATVVQTAQGNRGLVQGIAQWWAAR